ncbi:MAG TPA: enoyl-CoA hydratase/isomerase family protein [Candidatus Limnocylindrales bacterium]|nr:enoyl-CoA hydratase/isomerase family protein [Candidatus Limnocylindrales bacterium]
MSTIRTIPLVDDAVLLTLARPPANAIDEHLLIDLHATLVSLRTDDSVRAVVITGSGAFFSAGFDFSAPRRDDEIALDLYRRYRDCHLALLTMPKPTIAWINGHAIAGGFVIALACDHRIAAGGDYRIGMNEVAVGASFPRTAMEIVRLRLTHAQASELVLGAQLFPSSKAVALGLAHEIVARESIETHVRALAGRLAAFPCDAYARTKQALVADAERRILAETDSEAVATMSVWISDESRAARRRQREKLNVR